MAKSKFDDFERDDVRGCARDALAMDSRLPSDDCEMRYEPVRSWQISAEISD